MPGLGITGTEAILGAAMKSNVDALMAQLGIPQAPANEQPVDRTMFYTALAKAVIQHIVTYGIATGNAPPGTAGGPILLGGII